MGAQHEAKLKAAQTVYEEALALHDEQERQRLSALKALQNAYEQACEDARRSAAEKNAEIAAFTAAYHERDAVVDYFDLVLRHDNLPDGFPLEFE